MYKVEVLTGNRRGAGTDANVHMEMYGARGKSGIRVLDNSENNFERNQTDTFNIDCMDLGDLTKIRIGVRKKVTASLTWCSMIIVDLEELGFWIR